MDTELSTPQQYRRTKIDRIYHSLIYYTLDVMVNKLQFLSLTYTLSPSHSLPLSLPLSLPRSLSLCLSLFLTDHLKCSSKSPGS